MNAKKKSRSIKIKNVQSELLIDKATISEDDYPVFCFKYLNDVSIKDCKKSDFFIEFLKRLKKLSELGWKEIRTSHRHSYGMEKIPIEKIHLQLPTCITPEVKHLYAFRATGNNLPFVGIEVQKIFRVLFIETNFGDIYNH